MDKPDSRNGLTPEELFRYGKQMREEEIAQAGGCIEKIKSVEEYHIQNQDQTVITGRKTNLEVDEIDNTYVKAVQTMVTAGDYVLTSDQRIEAFCHQCGVPVVSKRGYYCHTCRHVFCADHAHINRNGEQVTVICNACLHRHQRIFLTGLAVVVGIGLVLMMAC